MKRWLERLLNLRRGDLGRGSLLFSYLFLIMGSYVVARVARDTLFLDKFKAVQLPYVDLIIFALIGFVISGYLLLSQRVTLRLLLVASALFFASNTFVFWYLAYFHQYRWIPPVLYVWVGMFGVVAPAQVWTLGNYVLTTREAKRIFGFVAGGAIAGAIFGAKFASIMARRFGTESLLLGITVALAACAFLVVLIWRQRRVATLSGEEDEERPVEEKPPPLRKSLKLVWSAPYLRSLAFLILVANIVTSMAGWQFKALAKMFIPQKDALAAFFGDFYFYAGIAGLLVQVLVTTRLIRRFGLLPALFVVPAALFFGSIGVLFWGAVTIWAAIGLRSCINVLQYSIDKPSVELLYLPVPADIKNQVKSFIDTVVWRAGDGLAAIGVLIFATTIGWSAMKVSLVNLVVILGWFVAAFFALRQYVGTLREAVHQHRLDAERVSVPVLDQATTEIIVENLRAADPRDILYALSLLTLERHRAAHPVVRDLIHHPAPEVRQKAISILASARDKTVRPQIEKLLRDPDLEVRTEALLYLTHLAHVDPLDRIRELGDFPDFSIRSAMVAFLARPGETQSLETARLILDEMVNEAGPEAKRTRVEAARLLGILPDQFDPQLRQLLSSLDIEVAQHAIRAVGSLRARRFVPRALERLAEPELVPVVVEALGQFGDPIVGTLRDHLNDPDVPLAIRREIPGILAVIATPAAQQALVENLLESDTALRFKVISALNKIRHRHPEIELDTQIIETVLAAEIMGHYRSYQILGTLGGELSSDDPVVRALRESMDQEVERIFRLLGLLWPQYDFHSAYVGLQSSDAIVHDNALELLDNILKPQLRNLLVPLVDSEISIAERVRRADALIRAKVETREEAVAALVRSEDPWLKACGAYAIGIFGLKSLEAELDHCLSHPDPLLHETARQAKMRLGSVPEAVGQAAKTA